MRIGMRVDASTSWGTGHVMRCLTLANELRTLGAEVFFLCRRRPGDLVTFIQGQGYHVYEITGAEQVSWEEDAARVIQILINVGHVDWLVVDHYGLDARWEKVVNPLVERMMVIDDLANRPHECDLLLDQNLYGNMKSRYDDLIPDRTVVLLGPEYTLLREEFLEAKEKPSAYVGTIDQLLVSFGGSDPTNETMKTLKAVMNFERRPSVDVVLGDSSPHKRDVLAFCEREENFNVHIQTHEMARLMKRADLAIGAGGSSVWERCYMELPSMVIETADNQREIIECLREKGAIFYLGKSKDISSEQIFQELDKVMKKPELVRNVWTAVKEIMKDHQSYGVSKYMIDGGLHE